MSKFFTAVFVSRPSISVACCLVVLSRHIHTPVVKLWCTLGLKYDIVRAHDMKGTCPPYLTEHLVQWHCQISQTQTQDPNCHLGEEDSMVFVQPGACRYELGGYQIESQSPIFGS